MTDDLTHTAVKYGYLQPIDKDAIEGLDPEHLLLAAKTHFDELGTVVEDTLEMEIAQPNSINGRYRPQQFGDFVPPPDTVIVKFTAYVVPKETA